MIPNYIFNSQSQFHNILKFFSFYNFCVLLWCVVTLLIGDLGLESLEEGMATYSNILPWIIPMDRGAWWPSVHGAAKSQTHLSD